MNMFYYLCMQKKKKIPRASLGTAANGRRTTEVYTYINLDLLMNSNKSESNMFHLWIICQKIPEYFTDYNASDIYFYPVFFW